MLTGMELRVLEELRGRRPTYSISLSPEEEEERARRGVAFAAFQEREARRLALLGEQWESSPALSALCAEHGCKSGAVRVHPGPGMYAHERIFWVLGSSPSAALREALANLGLHVARVQIGDALREVLAEDVWV